MAKKKDPEILSREDMEEMSAAIVSKQDEQVFVEEAASTTTRYFAKFLNCSFS